MMRLNFRGNSSDLETDRDRFKGRQDLFWELDKIASMSPAPTLLLHEVNRTGKTAIFKYLPQKVGSNLISLIVDVRGIADATTLFEVAEFFVQQMTDSARLSRNLILPTIDPEELEIDPFPTLQDWFRKIEHTFPNQRFLLCLDEFDRFAPVMTATNSRAPLNFLRYIRQNRNAWTLLFLTSRTLDELEDYWSDYLIDTRSVRA